MTKEKEDAVVSLVSILAKFIFLVFILGLGLWKIIEDDKRVDRDQEFFRVMFEKPYVRYDSNNIWAKYVDSVLKLKK